ncbi:GC-rich sequence DNA-binding factor 2 isoform X2 [Engraulis encrasicolus]|uniref:GC-rich sequence DNA-binding factor 2 isoform X2 n=1 Tax=Engraulis encrasicolus TaxID=184585 RepID=UPI002FD1EE8F
MFRKTTRRNIRERKDDSSEDEKKDDEDNSEMQCLQIKPKPQNRGITCSSKARKSPSKSDSSEDEKDEIDVKTSRVGPPGSAAGKVFGKSKQKVYSFDDDNDESEFKVRKNKDKLVVFNAPKKEDLPAITDAKDVPQRKQAMAESESDTMQDEKDESDDSDVSSLTRSSHSSRSSRSPAPATSIPSAQRIHAAKAARKHARAPRDYIPLDGYREGTPGTGEEEEEEDDRDDRVEQDSDNELDDHEHRIDFAPKPRTLKERMAEEMGHSDSEDSSMDSDEAEAQSLWEAQQVEKGVKRPQLSRNECVVLSDLLENILQISSSKQSEKRRKRMRIPESLPAVSYSIIKKRITGKLESLRGVHRAHEADLRRLQFDVDEAKSSLENMEKTAAEEQLKFYRNMRVYADNLVECLTEKTVLINSVEMDMHSLYIDQAEALLTRRREQVRGESTRLQQLTFNVGNQASEESTGALNGSQNSEAIEKALELGGPPEDENADPEQEAELQQKRVDILEKAKDIFSDVQADFSDISKILSRFDEWRRSFADSYNNAYIGLCLPKLLGPIVRQQLIGWNPLQSDGEDFEALPWYSAVEKFCHGQGHEQSDNADEKTIPAIIEKTILPKVQGFVELVWDPLSLSHTQSLTVLCKRLQDDYSIFSRDQSKPVKAFLASVTSRLRSAVDEDVFIPLLPKKYLDDQSSPQCKFHAQQFWSAVKLLGNMSLWDELLPEHALKELMLDKLLNRYLMMTLLNEANVELSVNKSKKVAACFPKSWFEQLDARTSLPQLKNFCSHLLQTGHLVCKDTANPDRTRDILKTLFSIMADIKAWDDLTTIAEKYHHTDLMNQLF